MIDAPVTPAEKLRILADMGADPNIEDREGRTPLHIIPIRAQNGADRVTMAQILFAKGARVNCRDANGDTPLHCTLHRVSPDYEFIEFLLKNGADPNMEDHTGRKPLRYAREFLKSPEIVNALVRAGGTA